MKLCEVCGKNNASRTIAQIPFCDKCYGDLQKIRIGDEEMLERYADKSAYALSSATPAAADYVLNAVKTARKNKEEESPLVDEEQVSEKAVTAAEAPVNQANEQKEKSDNKKVGCGCLTIFLAAILFFMLLMCCSSGSSDNSSSKNSKGMAFLLAKDVVTEQLKAPSTAEFCEMNEATIINTADSDWTISGYVDAENSFGAMIRSDWTVKLTINSDEDTYTIHYVSID